jgi:hypothetical protein
LIREQGKEMNMNRRHMHAIACVVLTALISSLLMSGVSLSDSDGELSPAMDVVIASDPTLPRSFSLSVPLFASGSAWNQAATEADVLSESMQQILVTYRVLRGDTTDLRPPGPPPTTWPFMYVNYDEYTMPVFRAGAGEQSVLICDYEGNLWWPGPKFGVDREGGPVTVPPPASTVLPAGPEGTDSDGHVVLYHPDTSSEYDYWQATTVRDAECASSGAGFPGDTILEAGAIDFFDVRGYGANPDTYSSARATGPPLLAGLLLPEDVESGAIEHALAFAIPGPRNTSADPSEPLSSDYFYPASTTETGFYNTNSHALAAGQRIRLKQTLVDDGGDPLDENQLVSITRMFLTALRTYGAYLVDNSGGFTFYAEDIHTAVLHLTEDEVNALIGQPPGTPLPAGKTKWQIAIEKLNEELEQIPFAYGPWQEGQDPAEAQIEASNFEVVEPATRPVTGTSMVYLPLALNSLIPAPPSTRTPKLIFIHHSTGENWLADWDGGLGVALRDNNYFVSDTNYDWGPADADVGDGTIGDHTDIGHWYNWFVGPHRDTYLGALYAEYRDHSYNYSRLDDPDPGRENEIIMFKSCFPNSGLEGSRDDPPTSGDNPLRGQDVGSEHHTVANAKGIYNDLLAYFRTRQDKLFVVITAPPLVENSTDATQAANARAFNDWLVNDWLDGYSHNNVAVFDFYNVLTSNGGDADTNDLGQGTGNHHRWWNGAVQHIQTVDNDYSAYGSDEWDSHPTAAGNQKAGAEFVPLLNLFYQRWQSSATVSTREPGGLDAADNSSGARFPGWTVGRRNPTPRPYALHHRAQ